MISRCSDTRDRIMEQQERPRTSKADDFGMERSQTLNQTIRVGWIPGAPVLTLCAHCIESARECLSDDCTFTLHRPVIRAVGAQRLSRSQAMQSRCSMGVESRR